MVVGRDELLVGRVPEVGLVDQRQLGDTADELGDAVVAGDIQDRVVEDEVLTHEVIEAPLAGDRVETVTAAAQLGELARGGTLGGEAGSHTLEGGAQHVEVTEVVEVVRADGGAAIRARLDEAVGLEDEQRLAHRSAGDAELAGELLLLQPLARREPPIHDRLADDLDGHQACVLGEWRSELEKLGHSGVPYCMQDPFDAPWRLGSQPSDCGT